MTAGNARGRLPGNLDSLLTSQMDRAITEANLGITDTLIARRYMIDRMAQIDIAAELDCERSTVSRRLKNITPRVSLAASQNSFQLPQ